jgi:CHAD domain-containing protein
VKAPNASRKQPLDEGSCIYGAGIILGHLSALEGEAQGIAASEKDIEYIHRARVASRRLRATLPLFRDCLPEKKAKSWLKQIRAVTRALGQARDLDVQIERVNAFITRLEDPRSRPGMLRLRLRLSQQRAHAQVDVLAAVKSFTESKTIEALREHFTGFDQRKENVYLYTPALYRHSFDSIQQRLEDFLGYREIIHDPAKVTELHEMRIAAKWLRYTMETFAALYSNQLRPYLKATRTIQEQLGDIHDCDVWQQFLEDFLASEQNRIRDYFGHARPYGRLVAGIQAFEANRRAAREKVYAEFVQDWDRLEARAIWDDLMRALQVPFPQPEAIYPPLAQPDSGSTED